MSAFRSDVSRVSALLCLVLLAPLAAAQQSVRVATYNIKFFNAQVPTDRLNNLRQVIATLDADVIGLQEIDDRAALEKLFPPAQWDIVIDDESGDNQDVAVVVRHPLHVSGMTDLDADDQHFLFSGPAHNSAFPNRRDLLCVPVAIPGETEPLFMMVHHAKARVGGRNATDARREEAARKIVAKLEQDFDDKRFVIVGDMNDNPDDRSMAILETGQSGATGGPEEIEGPFLLNLCEPLVAQDRVSWGLKANDVSNGKLNTVEPDSRQKNNAERGSTGSVSPILFDQILCPVSMKSLCAAGSATIFDDGVAVLGGSNAPSDHVPVYADFTFGGADDGDTGGGGSATGGLSIAEMLPNPAGTDDGNEEIVLRNSGSTPVDLTGWSLRDRSDHVLMLTGTVPANGTLTIKIPAGELPLTNSGDEVTLLNPGGAVVDRESYTANQAGSGVRIGFP